MRYKGVTDIDSYTGAVTGASYPFGLLRRRGYVDARDVSGLLATREDGLEVFERWQAQ